MHWEQWEVPREFPDLLKVAISQGRHPVHYPLVLRDINEDGDLQMLYQEANFSCDVPPLNHQRKHVDPGEMPVHGATTNALLNLLNMGLGFQNRGSHTY